MRYLVGSQRGGMLIEIMMSALLVGLAATAVFKGIDGATATSAQSKSRAVATSLAHEDQERMRAMDPRKLASYSPGPATKTVNRVNYTVTSTADWVSDRGDSESCSKGDGRVTYVKISSKVEWPDMNGSKPVIASSIVAINNAYAKGSLAVKLVDRTGSGPVKDVPVSVDPPLSLSRNTNDAGCVVFDGLNAGAYYGHFAKSGYVDPNGVNDVRPVNGWNVTTGSTSISTYQYDLAGTINFSFVTTIGSTEYAVKADPTVASQVAVEHQGIPGPPSQGVRRDSVAAGSATYDFDDLFPFTTAYSAYASACDADGPAAVWTSAIVPPGGFVAAKLPLPPVRVKVTRTVAPKKGVPGERRTRPTPA